MYKKPLEKYLSLKTDLVNQSLKKYLPLRNDYPPIIHEAINYSVFSGGKRIRPILTLATYELFNSNMDNIIPFAIPLELIHTYSLIHDDLPSMDNDDYRRGKLSCHKKFGEHIALLAGDALLTLSFEILSGNSGENIFPPEKVLKVINEISRAIGTKGMIGGQVMDMESEGDKIDIPLLQYIHIHKTGELFHTAVKIGAILGGASEEELFHISRYGENFGLAFQIADDIFDENQDKTGSKKKISYTAVFNLEESKKRASELIDNAKAELKIFKEKGIHLANIAEYIIHKL